MPHEGEEIASPTLQYFDLLSQLCDAFDCHSMPAVNVVFYQKQPGNSPVVDWLRILNETNPRAAFTANPAAHTFKGETNDA
jgi:hypothetical protein